MKKNWVYSSVLLLTLSIASCFNPLDLVKPSAGTAVDTEIVAGDKTQEVNTAIGETNNTAENITQNIDEVDYVTIGLLVLSVATGAIGWALPVPKFLQR